MRTTKSIWEATSGNVKSFGELNTDIQADVVIVGGGISGLTTAMLLSDAGKNVVLLEAGRVGRGTTGNSTGNLYVTVDEHLSKIKRKWNAEVMKAIVASRTAGLNLIQETVNKYAIKCSFIRTSFNYFVEETNQEIEEFLIDEFNALQECGLEPSIGGNPGMPFGITKSLSVANQAQFQPMDYVRGLVENMNPNCVIYENSPVIDYDVEKGTVKTKNGNVRAENIVLATHTPIGVFSVHTVLGPYREFGVAAPLKSGNVPAGIFWGSNNPKHSVRIFSDNKDKYVMVIGDKFKTGHHGNSSEYIQGLESYLSQRFDIGPFKYIWGGQQYRAADGLPYMGKHGKGLYFITGLATDGLVYGSLGAMIVSDQILGRENKWEKMYSPSRHTPLKSAGHFLKENADNLVQYLKDTPWNADAKKLEEINPGEGKVLEEKGEKLAVYKDEYGKEHVVSAVCTHMKCVVTWNSSEKSWDCPCHGSRFTIDGDVIEGPAISPLPKKEVQK